MDPQKEDECSQHKGEKKFLICLDPCKAHICQKCLKSNAHPKHDVQFVEDVAEELLKRLDTISIAKTNQGKWSLHDFNF